MDPKDKASEDQKEQDKSTIDFSSFLLSLSTQAFISLGEVKNPVTGETKVDINAAKQVIDIIYMLKNRTKGNLNSSENELLETILYDLRLKFIEKSKQIKK